MTKVDVTRALHCAALACCALASSAQDAPLFKSEVKLVGVPVAVSSRAGTPVANLRAEDFTLKEDGKTQRIEHVYTQNEIALNMVIITDATCSAPTFSKQHHEATLRFMQHFGKAPNRVGVVVASDRAYLVSPLADSEEALDAYNHRGPLRAAIGAPCQGARAQRNRTLSVSCGNQLLWSTVYYTADLMFKAQPGRNVIVLLSDGRDSGSDHSVEQAARKCQETDTSVYVIRWSPKPGPFQWEFWPDEVNREEAAPWALKSLAESTGAIVFDGLKLDLTAILERIKADLGAQYVLEYAPRAMHPPGTYHKLSVKVKGATAVRAREGYVAR